MKTGKDVKGIVERIMKGGATWPELSAEYDCGVAALQRSLKRLLPKEEYSELLKTARGNQRKKEMLPSDHILLSETHTLIEAMLFKGRPVFVAGRLAVPDFVIEELSKLSVFFPEAERTLRKLKSVKAIIIETNENKKRSMRFKEAASTLQEEGHKVTLLLNERARMALTKK